MPDIQLKNALEDYTRAEFKTFVAGISENKAGSEAEGDIWLEHFISIVPHPAKSDLIYWPDDGADGTPEGIATEVERYCVANGLPGFKDGP